MPPNPPSPIRFGAATVIMAVAALAAACGPNVAHSRNPTAAQLRSALLTAGLINRLPGAPQAGFVQAPPSRSRTTPNPNPRGPCGAKMSMPSLKGGAAAAFFSDAAQVEIFQTVNRLAPGVAGRLLDFAQADAQPGCPAYTSTALYGPQVTQLLRIIPLPGVGDQRIAMDVRGRTVGSQRWGYGSEILIRRGPDLLMIGSFSAGPLPDRFVRGLAVAAAARFANVP